MCKCEIGKCAHAESKLLDGKIRCSARGETVSLKRCSDYVPLVVTNENIKNKFPEINHFIEKPKDEVSEWVMKKQLVILKKQLKNI